MNPVTWNQIHAFLQTRYPQSMTNRAIASALDADMQDVTSLTRIMAKAGEIALLRGDPSHAVSINLYRANSREVRHA